MTSRRKQKDENVVSSATVTPDPVARGSGIALWRQIAQDLEIDILSARLVAGDRLPTEAELSTRYAVNRHTLRRALSELSRKGLIEATPGLGTFVAKSRLAYPISQNMRFSEIVAGAGREPGGQLISAEESLPPAEIAALLELPVDAATIKLDLLRVANDTPICVSTSWFPAERFKGLGELFARTRSITKSLRSLGVSSYRRKLSRISARPANSGERSALNLGPGGTVLVVEALNVEAGDRPIQATRSRFSAVHVELVVET